MKTSLRSIACLLVALIVLFSFIGCNRNNVATFYKEKDSLSYNGDNESLESLKSTCKSLVESSTGNKIIDHFIKTQCLSQNEYMIKYVVLFKNGYATAYYFEPSGTAYRLSERLWTGSYSSLDSTLIGFDGENLFTV